MARKLNILHTVEFYAPSVGGAQEAVRQISEQLVALGHDVTVATSSTGGASEERINGVKIRRFAVSGNYVHGLSGSVDEYRRFVLEGEFDVLMNYAAQQWTTDAILEILPKIPARKVFVPCGFSGLKWPLYGQYFARMAGWMREYDAVVLLSKNYRDADFSRKHSLANTHLIPNGASEDDFLCRDPGDIRKRLGIAENDFLILHVGSHTGMKGHAEAIRIFLLSRIRNSTLVIVANDFGGGCGSLCRAKAAAFAWKPIPSMLDKRLLIIDLPRQETLMLYKTADLFLFPSNIECSPLVLFEAAASATPFLASSAGNSAEIAQWTGAGEIIETTENLQGIFRPSIRDGSRRLTALWGDRMRREQMGAQGRFTWANRFTWRSIASRYESLYLSLVTPI